MIRSEEINNKNSIRMGMLRSATLANSATAFSGTLSSGHFILAQTRAQSVIFLFKEPL